MNDLIERHFSTVGEIQWITVYEKQCILIIIIKQRFTCNHLYQLID